MLPEEKFLQDARSFLTGLATSAELLKRAADSFEARGGQPVFGDDALFIVFLSNDLQAWLTPERRATIARLRADI